MPNAFGGKAGFYMTQVISFLRENRQLLLWLGAGGTGDGGTRAGAWSEAGFLLRSVAITTLPGVGSDPKLALFPEVPVFPSPRTRTLDPE